MATHFMGTLAAKLTAVASTSLELCNTYECDILKTLPTLERRKVINEKIKEIERKEYFFSRDHSVVLYEYANQKLRILKHMKEDIDEELDSSDLKNKVSAGPDSLSVETLRKIKELISNSDSGWDETISILESNLIKETEEYDTLVHIQAQISAFKKDNIINILSRDDQDIRRNKITHSLLEFIKLLENK